MVAAAAVLTFLFKKDKDASSFEDDMGKMVQGSRDLMPANKGARCLFLVVTSEITTETCYLRRH